MLLDLRSWIVHLFKSGPRLRVGIKEAEARQRDPTDHDS
jgi:hypothetical protein